MACKHAHTASYCSIECRCSLCFSKGKEKVGWGAWGECEEGEHHGPLHSAIRPEKVNCFISTSLKQPPSFIPLLCEVCALNTLSKHQTSVRVQCSLEPSITWETSVLCLGPADPSANTLQIACLTEYKHYYRLWKEIIAQGHVISFPACLSFEENETMCLDSLRS